MSNMDQLFDVCELGKANKKTFSARKDRGKNIGAQMHAYLCYPISITSMKGAKYSVCFKNNF